MLSDKECQDIIKRMPDYHLFQRYIENGVAHDFLWNVCSWINEIEEQSKNEIADKEALIVLASKKMLIAKSLVDFELQSELEECFSFAEEMFKDGNINEL